MIRNEVIRGKMEVTCVTQKMRELKLRWCGHEVCECTIRRCEMLAITGEVEIGSKKNRER